MTKLAAQLHRGALPRPQRPLTPLGFSIFSSLQRDGSGRVKRARNWRHNLRTTIGIDHQAKQMGGSGGKTGSGATSITSTGASLTGLDNTGGATTTYRGQWLQLGTALMRINTSSVANPSVIVGDGWITGDGVAAATPTTSVWNIAEGGVPCNFLALSSTVQSGAVGDTTLAGEFTTNGLSRAKAVYAHTGAATTYTLSNTYTASGAGGTVNSEAVFSEKDTTGGGVMPFESAEPTPPALLAADTLAQTVTVNI